MRTRTALRFKDGSALGRPWCFLCAGVLVLQVFSLGALPFEAAEPGNTIWHVLAYSALTLLLWIATDGRRPVLVTAGVMALCLADELRQAAFNARGADIVDFLAGSVAAAATGAVLYCKTGVRKCVESSAQ
jgi:VanZ family protein